MINNLRNSLQDNEVIFPPYWDVSTVCHAFATLSTAELYNYFGCRSSTSFGQKMKPCMPNRPAKQSYQSYIQGIISKIQIFDSSKVFAEEAPQVSKVFAEEPSTLDLLNRAFEHSEVQPMDLITFRSLKGAPLDKLEESRTKILDLLKRLDNRLEYQQPINQDNDTN